jgi:uncharacterized membrane protein
VITYKCPKCAFSFNQSDRTWDEAVVSGNCPNCNSDLVGFAIPTKMPELFKTGHNKTISSEIEKLIDKSPMLFFFNCIYSVSFITALIFGKAFTFSKKMRIISYAEAPGEFMISFTISAIIFALCIRWFLRSYKQSLTPHPTPAP